MWPFKKRTKPTISVVPISPPVVKQELQEIIPKTYGEKVMDKDRGKWTVRVYYWNADEGKYNCEEATGAETYIENLQPAADKMYEDLMRKHGGQLS